MRDETLAPRDSHQYAHVLPTRQSLNVHVPRVFYVFCLQTGHMRTSTGNYLIKPTERWTDSEKSPATVGSPLQHVIYRLPKSSEPLPTGHQANRTANDLPDDDISPAAGPGFNETRECGVIGKTFFSFNY